MLHQVRKLEAKTLSIFEVIPKKTGEDANLPPSLAKINLETYSQCRKKILKI